MLSSNSISLAVLARAFSLCYNGERKVDIMIEKYVAQFEWEALLFEGISKVLSLVLLSLVFYLLKKVIGVSVRKILAPSLQLSNQDRRRQETISRLVENVLNYLLYFIVLYWTLTILGLPVSSLFAGAGIAGVAIGLGAQGFLSDLVNGFFILLERQFDVGDSVRLTNGPITISGHVVSVGIRTTQVRGADGTLHFIPNRNILVVSNQSRGDMRVEVDLPLSPTVNLEQVAGIVQAVNAQHLPAETNIKACTVLGPQMSKSGQFSYRVQFFVANGQQSQVYHRFYGLYQEALLKEGLALTT